MADNHPVGANTHPDSPSWRPTPNPPTWDTGADFNPSPKARQIPRRPSPLAQEYNTSDFKRWHISSGVVVVDEV